MDIAFALDCPLPNGFGNGHELEIVLGVVFGSGEVEFEPGVDGHVAGVEMQAVHENPAALSAEDLGSEAVGVEAGLRGEKKEEGCDSSDAEGMVQHCAQIYTANYN